MDTGKMTTGQKMVVYGGVFLVFNLLFVPWYQVDPSGGSSFINGGIGVDGFSAGFYAWFGSLCAIGAAALVHLKVAGRGKPTSWQVKPEYIALGLAATGFVLILVRLITEANSVFLGTILGLLVTAGMTFAAFLDSGLKLPQAKQGGAEPPPPPPPPPPA